eukprot:g77328.t1
MENKQTNQQHSHSLGCTFPRHSDTLTVSFFTKTQNFHRNFAAVDFIFSDVGSRPSDPEKKSSEPQNIRCRFRWLGPLWDTFFVTSALMDQYLSAHDTGTNSEWTSQGFSPSPCTARRKSPRFSPYIKRSLSRSASRDGLSSLCITQSVSPCSSPCISQSSTPVFQRDMDFSLVRMTQCATPSMLARTLRRDGAPTTPLDRAVDMYLKNDELGALIEDLQNYQITKNHVSVNQIQV